MFYVPFTFDWPNSFKNLLMNPNYCQHQLTEDLYLINRKKRLTELTSVLLPRIRRRKKRGRRKKERRRRSRKEGKGEER